jgi:hypothetical protein
VHVGHLSGSSRDEASEGFAVSAPSNDNQPIVHGSIDPSSAFATADDGLCDIRRFAAAEV